MNKQFAKEIWRKLLFAASSGKHYLIKNPMLEFTDTKSNMLSVLSDEEYAEQMYSARQLSHTLWNGDDSRWTSSMLLEALHSVNLSEQHLEKMAELLAEASAGTDYPIHGTHAGHLHFSMSNSPDYDESKLQTLTKIIPLGNCAPQKVEKWLREYGDIVGQEAAVRAASLILYNHYHGRPSVSLFAAPTGSGKTQLWRALQKLCGKDTVVIHDASTLTAEGWKGGNKISTIFKSLADSDSENIILVLDEFDKLIEPQYGGNGTNYADIVQNQLLKLFDHDTVFFGSENGGGFSVNTSCISVVLLGVFQRLMEKKSLETCSIGFGGNPVHTITYSNTQISYEDLVEFGMREELAGRITRITSMEPLNTEDIARIGRKEIRLLESQMNCKITIDDKSFTSLSDDAVKKGLGARWLKSTLSNMLDELIYENPELESYKLEYNPLVNNHRTSGL